MSFSGEAGEFKVKSLPGPAQEHLYVVSLSRMVRPSTNANDRKGGSLKMDKTLAFRDVSPIL